MQDDPASQNAGPAYSPQPPAHSHMLAQPNPRGLGPLTGSSQFSLTLLTLLPHTCHIAPSLTLLIVIRRTSHNAPPLTLLTVLPPVLTMLPPSHFAHFSLPHTCHNAPSLTLRTLLTLLPPSHFYFPHNPHNSPSFTIPTFLPPPHLSPLHNSHCNPPAHRSWIIMSPSTPGTYAHPNPHVLMLSTATRIGV